MMITVRNVLCECPKYDQQQLFTFGNQSMKEILSEPFTFSVVPILTFMRNSETRVAATPGTSCTRLLLFSILGRRYKWNFIVADVRTPLLGADFLAHFGLAVNVGCKPLLDTKSCQSLPLLLGPSEPTICSVAPHQYGSLLKEFSEVFKPEFCQVPGAPAKHEIYHHIKTRGPPTHAKFWRLPSQHLQEAKEAFAEME
ncbi:uncharacterized protein [Macrobrachium rosenbergii]|uniref:uncharacterized protein n=1 Tax=Macrobrachium rosenbergii TaxID=79674 RepID=UPI0034D4414E